MVLTNSTMLHVRFNGRSEDLDLAALDVRADASDDELRAALAQRYRCTASAFDEYIVVREPQAIIVRPIAFYG